MTSTNSTAIRFFIGVPARDQGSVICGLGTSEEGAVMDAYDQTNTRPATVEQNESGNWVVWHYGEPQEFPDESDARQRAEQLGFVARECTERMFVWIKENGAPVGDFSWGGSGYPELDDLEVDQDLVDAAVAEVEAGFEGCTAHGDWTVEAARSDAHAYVDAYVLQDENVDEDLRDEIKASPQLRLAIDLAVRDLILDTVASHAAA